MKDWLSFRSLFCNKNKRATDAQDDDPPIDVSPDIVSQTERPEVVILQLF
jgi:hypothetical protein